MLALQQDRLYAQDTYGILMVFQAMDAAGKDGTIRHVMSGINPQGCQVFSFKAPSAEERDHDYLWRSLKAMPERGRIGIHNRSYYEEVLVARVHPEILQSQQLPASVKSDGIWKQRFDQINSMERYLVDNGIIVLKFFLNVSKKEQKKRFLERIDNPDKNWKFSVTTPRSARSGRTTCAPTRTCSPTPAPSGRPGTSSRRTTSGSPVWRSRQSSTRRSRISICSTRRSPRKSTPSCRRRGIS